MLSKYGRTTITIFVKSLQFALTYLTILVLNFDSFVYLTCILQLYQMDWNTVLRYNIYGEIYTA